MHSMSANASGSLWFPSLEANSGFFSIRFPNRRKLLEHSTAHRGDVATNVQKLIGWLLGAALGIRHAVEPDHLAAISTLVGEEPGARRGTILGKFWGIGHSLGCWE
jgi:hypothetical protein